MPNYRRPRRSRSDSDPDFKHIPGRAEQDDQSPASWDEDEEAWSDADLDDDELDAVELDGVDLARLSADLGEAFEIVDLAHDDWDDDWDDDDIDALARSDVWADRWLRAAQADVMPLDELLQVLASDAALPPLEDLYALSDLTQGEADEVRRHWSEIAPERRRALVECLVTGAEENLNLELGPFLRIAMTDADAGVRSTAVRGLWEDGRADLVGPLVQMLQNDADEDARAAAATALGSYVLAGELEELEAAPAMRAEEALLAVLHDDRTPVAVRRRALESVAYSGEAGIRQLIEDAYYSPYEEMRISALFAMGRSADVRWRPLARAELQNPTPAVRAEAALACGELEAKTALNDLLALLDDPEPDVRLAAIFALGRIGGRDARDALDVVRLGGVPEEVEAVEQALEEMQFYADNDAIPLYDETLDDEDVWDSDPGDGWDDWDDRDLGQYE